MCAVIKMGPSFLWKNDLIRFQAITGISFINLSVASLLAQILRDTDSIIEAGSK